MSVHEVKNKNWTAPEDGWLYKVLLPDKRTVLWFSQVRLDMRSLVLRREIQESNGTSVPRQSPIRDDWKKEIFGDKEGTSLMDKPDRTKCPSEELILDYLTNDLDPDERAKVEEHLGLCPLCSCEVAAIESTMKKKFGASLKQTDDTKLSGQGAASSDEPS